MEPGVVFYVISNADRLLVPIMHTKLVVIPKEVVDPRTGFDQLCSPRIQCEPVL